MKCPRCSTSFTAASDAQGSYVCPACGARLRTRAAAPASATPAPPRADPGATLPPDTRLKPLPRPGDPPATLEMVLAEVRAIRHQQEELLAMFSQARGPKAGLARIDDDDDEDLSPPPPVVRARRRKTVLVIDDEEATRAVALVALEAAQVPSRAVASGSAGIEAIAAEKPDVIVLELDVGGEMAGKDVINMIKATMEWVDIPIILYTRLPIPNQKEARVIHGADELVPKGPGSAEALVQRVIQTFRRA